MVRGARFWQNRVAMSCIAQWYVALADGSASADASQIPISIGTRELEADVRICIGIGTRDGPHDG